MAIRDKMQEKAAPHLRPGEQVQAIFGAQTTTVWWMALIWLVFLIKNNYRVVVVTDQRILVNDSRKWTTTNSKSVALEAPRATRIGPASGLWYKTEALGETLYIHKRFHKDVETADAHLGAAA